MCHQVTWCWEGLVTLYALKWLLSRVRPLMFLQVASYLEALFNFEHLKGFSLMWVLSKFYKWSDFKRLLSHFEHLKSCFSPVWVLSCSFKELDLKNPFHFCAPEWLLSSVWSHVLSSNFMFRSSCNTMCTWMASLPCGSSHVPSSGQLLRRSCHSLSTCMASLPYGSFMFLQVARTEIILSYFEHPKCPMVSMLISLFHYLCTWMASLPCGSSYVLSSAQLLGRSCHTLSI